MKVFTIIVFLFLFKNINSQDRTEKVTELVTWTLLQAVPSPTYFQDHDKENSGLRFGLAWNISPVNFSFNSNKLVSPVSFFKVNPVRRYGGSVELFAQPQWMTGEYEYSDLSRFHVNTGIRWFIPLIERGERLALSTGLKYAIREVRDNDRPNYFGIP